VSPRYPGASFESFSEERQHAAAELVGIFAGDGTMYRTNSGVVIEIRGNPEEAQYYFEICEAAVRGDRGDSRHPRQIGGMKEVGWWA